MPGYICMMRLRLLLYNLFLVQVRELAIAYLLVAASYIIIGSVVYVGFPLAKSCIEDVRWCTLFPLFNKKRSKKYFVLINNILITFYMFGSCFRTLAVIVSDFS